MATSLGEEKLWIQTSCRPGKGGIGSAWLFLQDTYKSSTPITEASHETGEQWTSHTIFRRIFSYY